MIDPEDSPKLRELERGTAGGGADNSHLEPLRGRGSLGPDFLNVDIELHNELGTLKHETIGKAARLGFCPHGIYGSVY